MKKVLIVKTSSMGDIIHALPAVSDLAENHPDYEIHWLCEKNFSEIPKLHHAVSKVINIEFRKWRKNIFKYRKEFIKAIKELRKNKYDYIVDCQGLFKSALWVKLARGKSYGYSYKSILESLASIFYNNKIFVEKNINVIKKNRLLFSEIFGYEVPAQKYPELDSRLRGNDEFCGNDELGSSKRDYVVFIHGTTWPSKKWPLDNWVKLSENLIEKNIIIKIPYYNNQEYDFAKNIRDKSGNENIKIINTENLSPAINLIKNSSFVYAVDTGLGHLAAYLNIPSVMLFGPTDAAIFSGLGENQRVLQSGFKCTKCHEKNCYYSGVINYESVCMKGISAENNYE